MDDQREPAWTEQELRRVGYRVVDMLARYLTELPQGPVFRPVADDTAARLAEAELPDAPTTPDAILDAFADIIAPFPFGNGHPRFFGWVNSPPEPMGIFAEALAAAMNPSCAGGNHAAIHLEAEVCRWMAELVGMPGAKGLLVSGGSMAALTALAVARQRAVGSKVRTEGVGAASGPLRVYKSAEGHGCYQKAVELLGLGSQSLHLVAGDEALRMRPSALDEALCEDRARGHVPMAVVASAGTVNTGAIDPLAEIAAVCRKHGVWLHVDGAYGAPAVLSEGYREALAPMGQADSVAVDPHKWLYVPVECGLVLVKDAPLMRDTFSLVPEYLRTEARAGGVSAAPWLSEYGFQQTRGFRALKLWMALMRRGKSGYRAAVEHDLASARTLVLLLEEAKAFELWKPQGLSIVAFRYAPPDATLAPEESDALNRRLVEAVQLGGRAFVSLTTLGGRAHMRACFVNPLTRRGDIEELVAAVLEAARTLV